MVVKTNDMLVIGGELKDRTATIQNQVGTDGYQTNLGEPIKRTTPTFTDANTIFFDKTGNDGNPGTSASPKLTIGNALTTCDSAAPAFVYVVCQDSEEYYETDIIAITKLISIYAKSGETPILKLTTLTKISQIAETAEGIIFSNIYDRYYYTNNAINGNIKKYDMPGASNIGATTNNSPIKIEFNGEIYVSLYVSPAILAKTTIGDAPLVTVFTGTTIDPIRVATDGAIMVIADLLSATPPFLYQMYYTADGTAYTATGIFNTGVIPALVIAMAMREGIIFIAISSGIYKSDDLGATFTKITDYAPKNGLVANNNSTRCMTRLNGRLLFWSNTKLYEIAKDNTTVTEILAMDIQSIDYDNGYYYIIDNSNNSIKRYNDYFVYIDTIIIESVAINDLAIKNGILIYGTSANLYQVLLSPLCVNTTQNLYYNGFRLDGNNIGSSNINVAPAKTIEYRHCQFINQLIPAGLEFTSESNFYNSVFNNSQFAIVAININELYECLFYNITDTTIKLPSNSAPMTIFSDNSIYNSAKFLRSVYTGYPIDFENIILLDLQGIFVENFDVAADQATLKNSIYNTELGQIKIDGSTAEVIRALFRDINNEDFRLKVVEAKASNGEYYPIDSPGKTYGCYQYVYTNNDQSYSFINRLEYKPTTATLSLIPIRENISTDGDGDIHKSIYDWRYEITLEWPDNNWTTQDFMHTIERLIVETKPFKLYFNGYDGIVSSNGYFDRDNLTLVDPTSGENGSEIKFPWNRYRGFWLELSFGGNSYEYFIDECYADQVILKDLKSNGLTGGVVNVTYKILYIVAICPENTFEVREEFFSQFIMDETKKKIGFRGFNLKLRAYHKLIT